MEEEATITGTEIPYIAVGESEEVHKTKKEAGNEELLGEGIEEVAGEHAGEEIDGEHLESEIVEGEGENKAQVLGEGEELIGEELEVEQEEEKVEEEEEKKEEKPAQEEQVEDEQGYVEEPPPDPSAPYDLTDSKEALKVPFILRPDQVAEIEQLWEVYQNYTPAYTDLDGYITKKELVYMLKSILLMTYTPEQLQELIAYCVRPAHPEGHITYQQFLRIVTLRQRDFPIEEELRSALQVFDPGRTGTVDREHITEVLAKQGNKMPQKQLDNLIKEVDMSNDGTIGIEDVVGTMCIDLNKEDLMMLKASLNLEENQ